MSRSALLLPKGARSIMSGDGVILAAKGGFLVETFRSSGFLGCVRKIASAIHMSVPLYLFKRRTNKSVGAYFDLITDDARMFYDDSFHFGFFHDGATSLNDGVNAHTDMVAKMARVDNARRILDIGCGVCAPAIRMAKECNGEIVGINISREQVRQANEHVEKCGLSDRIQAQYGNALELDFEDNSFDSVLCLEVAGDVCVTASQKEKFVGEIFRVLKPGGYVGFSDLVFSAKPTDVEEGVMRTILYHEGHELITDWPAMFENCGFNVMECVDMIEHTHPTWIHSLDVYKNRVSEVEKRYGKKIARSTMTAMERVPDIMKKYGAFIVFSGRKPE